MIIADDYRKVKKLSRKGRPSKTKPTETGLRLEELRSKQVILVGRKDRCLKIAKGLDCLRHLTTTVIATDDPDEGDFTDESTWVRAGIGSAHQITILAKDHSEISSTANFDIHEMDAEALLIAKFANAYSESLCEGSKPMLVAEMLSSSNQQLFLDAGLEVTIPADRILERVISKLIFSRGAATRFLMALLRLDDGLHFATFELSDPGTCRNFEGLVGCMPEYFQLLGVLPRKGPERRKWENTVGDFKYHFLTTATQYGAKDYVPKAGDLLVGIVARERWLRANEQRRDQKVSVSLTNSDIVSPSPSDLAPTSR